MLTSVFQELAIDIGERLRDARDLSVRFGEETITDIVLLDMKRKNPAQISVIQTPKLDESLKGTDWEWWIGSDRIGWLRYAVQAKRLHLPSKRYTSLTHVVGGQLQIDILNNYASANEAIPLYCFYNFVEGNLARGAWNCCQSFEEAQLGCTVIPSFVVRRAIEQHGAKNFSWIHSHQQSIPWRCLSMCPRIQSLYGKQVDESNMLLQDIFGEGNIDSFMHEQLPQELYEGRLRGRIEEFNQQWYSSEWYSSDFQRYPRRIAIMEFSQQEVEELTNR
jgi:hypothetical protein